MKKHHVFLGLVLFSLLLFTVKPAFIVGGVSKVNHFADSMGEFVLTTVDMLGKDFGDSKNSAAGTQSLGERNQILKIEIDSPPHPPDGRGAVGLTPGQVPASANLLPDFPAYSWVFGCSAVSAGMIAAYYDRNGYPDIYTGPTNDSVMPISDINWGTWTDENGDTYPNNPLVASQDGVDGYAGNGSIEDYWVHYGSEADDPFIDNWPEHIWETAIGDYMRTSQKKASNFDGATSFYFVSYFDPDPFTCEAMEDYDTLFDSDDVHLDGTFGLKEFYEARGFTITACYNQRTENQISGGFSLADFQAEINAGRPVLLNLFTYNLGGHSVVGYGYDGSTIYIRDTWHSDPNLHYTMTWGGSYQGYDLYAVSLVNLSPIKPLGFGKISPENAVGDIPLETTLHWERSAWAESYEYCLAQSDDLPCETWVNVGGDASVVISDLDRETNYAWQVRAINSVGVTLADGDDDAYWHFSTVPNPPSGFGKSAPGDGADDLSTTPVLSWAQSDGAVSYDYCFQTTNDSPCTGWQNTGAAVTVPLSGLAEGETYSWQVRAKNTGGTTYADGSPDAYWGFTTKLNPPQNFSKQSPIDDAINVLTTPTLTWEESPGAAYYEYCLGRSESCDDWIDNGQDTTVYVSGLNTLTEYAWQVRAVNAAGKTYADQGAFWHFTTIDIPQPGEFGKISPMDHAVGLSTPVTLTWEESAGVQRYEFCYNTTEKCQAWISNDLSTMVVINDLNPGTAYFWQVRAANDGGITYADGSAPSFWVFTTVREIYFPVIMR